MSIYRGQLLEGGVFKGVHLQTLDDACLHRLGVTDDMHRLVILECLAELIGGSSSLVSVHHVFSFGRGRWNSFPP